MGSWTPTTRTIRIIKKLERNATPPVSVIKSVIGNEASGIPQLAGGPIIIQKMYIDMISNDSAATRICRQISYMYVLLVNIKETSMVMRIVNNERTPLKMMSSTAYGIGPNSLAWNAGMLGSQAKPKGRSNVAAIAVHELNILGQDPHTVPQTV